MTKKHKEGIDFMLDGVRGLISNIDVSEFDMYKCKKFSDLIMYGKCEIDDKELLEIGKRMLSND